MCNEGTVMIAVLLGRYANMQADHKWRIQKREVCGTEAVYWKRSWLLKLLMHSVSMVWNGFWSTCHQPWNRCQKLSAQPLAAPEAVNHPLFPPTIPHRRLRTRELPTATPPAMVVPAESKGGAARLKKGEHSSCEWAVDSRLGTCS